MISIDLIHALVVFAELRFSWIGGQEWHCSFGHVLSQLAHPQQSAVQGKTFQVREKKNISRGLSWLAAKWLQYYKQQKHNIILHPARMIYKFIYCTFACKVEIDAGYFCE